MGSCGKHRGRTCYVFIHCPSSCAVGCVWVRSSRLVFSFSRSLVYVKLHAVAARWVRDRAEEDGEEETENTEHTLRTQEKTCLNQRMEQ